MKTLLALALSLSFVVSASAAHRQASYEDLVRWAGCEARLVTSDQHEVVESYYSPLEHALYVGTKQLPGLRPEMAEMVLFHEIGHCLQAQAGLGDLPTLVLELDADRQAADLACGLGRDGRQLLHDLFVWALKTYDYDGDPSHGTLVQRISQGENASLCRALESPTA